MLTPLFPMRDPKTLYDLRYYARRRGYSFCKNERIVTVPTGRRSSRVESRLTLQYN